MKRNFIIGGIIAGVGFVVLGITFLLVLSGKIDSKTAYTDKEYTATSKFKSVVVDDSNCPVNVYGTDKNYIYIKYSENCYETYSIKTDKDTLKIEKHNNRPWYQILTFNFSFRNRGVEVYIPKADLEELNVDTSNDEITIKDLNSKVMTLSTSNGSIEIKDSKINDALHMDTDNDSIWLSNVDVQGGEITGKTSNGDIDIIDTIANSFYMETSNDSITLKNISFATKGYFDTSNGDIEGTILGKLADFKEIKSETSNGDNSFPENNYNSSGTKSLTLSTSNDDIDVQIHE